MKKLFYCLLKAVSSIYCLLAKLERRFFECFSFLVMRPKAKVISIGNLTVGGTGKTPVLMSLLHEKQFASRTVVLTRGYMSAWERSFYALAGVVTHPNGLTDESILLNRHFPDVPVLIGKNRFHSAIIAQKTCKPHFMILDDGFQYRRIAKDVNLLLWDATTSVEEMQPLPMGRLREPLSAAAFADAILLTRCESVSDECICRWKSFFESTVSGIPLIEMHTKAVGWLSPAGSCADISEKPGKVYAFCALGRPQSFFSLLESEGCEIVKSRCFPDHHVFSAGELEDLASEAEKYDVRAVCTEKDLVKIPEIKANSMQLLALAIRMMPVSGESLGSILRRLSLI